MSSRIGVVPTRLIAASIALAFALCLLGVLATAQTDIQPKDEIFGGYSWLHPNAHVDNGFQVQDISKGFDFSNVYYLPSAHNLGVLGDVSGHWGNHVNAGTFWQDCSTSFIPTRFPRLSGFLWGPPTSVWG